MTHINRLAVLEARCKKNFTTKTFIDPDSSKDFYRKGSKSNLGKSDPKVEWVISKVGVL
jgi:hypothetical protein